jgi:hypothetical protein
MKRSDILFLSQLVKSLEEAEKKMEEYSKKKDYENFNKTKRIILKVQEEISKIVT